jgi:hypothetical protein
MLSESTKAQTCQKLTEMRLVDWLEFLLQTLWAIIMANAFDSIAQGLQEAIGLNDGKEVAEKRRTDRLMLTLLRYATDWV